MTSILENQEDDFDEEILAIYKNSSYEHIEKITSLLFELETDTTNLENILVEINRAAHSLKGDSNSTGFIKIGEIAHKMESYMGLIQKKEILFNNESLNELFNYVNKIKESLDNKFTSIKKEEVINNDYSNLKNYLNELLDILNKNSEDDINYDKIINKINKNKNLLNLNYSRNEINSILEKLNAKISEFEKSKSEKIIFPIFSYISDLLKILEEDNSISVINEINIKDDKTIRVSLDKIESLLEYSSELIANLSKYDYIITQINELQNFINEKNYEALNNKIFNIINSLKKENSHTNSIINNLNYDIKKIRMLPAKSLLEQMRIVARTASMKLGKLIKFNYTGNDIQLDLFLLEKIKDPLSHIIRNSISHGIEYKNERLKNNKNAEGLVELNIFISGSDIVFKIKDDGKGINYNKIKEKALNIGLITEEKANIITKEELNIIMFMPGFSTSDIITDISGRGVGLDVVKSTIESLGGFIKIDSEESKGTTFTIKISLKLTNFEALIFNLANKIFSIPVSYIENITSISLKDFFNKENKTTINFNNKEIKLFDLTEILNLTRSNENKLPEELFIITICVRDNYIAFIVDSIIEIREIVMKDLGMQVKKLKNISGTTILGDGTPIFVLNPYDLISSIETSFINNKILEIIKSDIISKEVKRRKALILDDSITTRTLEKNILESIGFEVKIATNGLEGTIAIKEFNPDIIITDCEMPEMDGYEFTRWVRNSEYKDLPIIMVTSLADNEFKLQGMEAGVDSYIVKGEFNQETFLDTIETLLI
ncbi:MAG: response regulator [Candidatus Sericytochromatia bacterium]